ncbi:MAG: translation initiation factor IF-2 [Candidatus Cloacimonadota bacterium]|nr:MAG: translation initiation factor IF-2 [Candidatus Cloacimonadota bacterium]
MALRVHELAKELKISTAALKKHLTDLGVQVKSHMSIVEDGIAGKIREKFAAQIAAEKQIESDRRRYHEKKKQQKKVRRDRPNPDNPFNDIKIDYRKNSDADQNNVAGDKRTTERKPVSNFVEKPIKKVSRPKRSTQTHADGDYKKKERGTSNQNKPNDRNYDYKTPGSDNKRKSEGKSGYSGQNSDYRNNRKENPKGETRAQENKRFSGNNAKKPYKPTPKANASSDTGREPVKTPKLFEKKRVDKDSLGSKSKHLKAKLKAQKSKKRQTFIPSELEQAEITKNIKAHLSKSTKKKKYKKEDKQEQQVIDNKIEISEYTSVNELAKIMGIQPTEIITKFFNLGQMVTMNQRLDKDSLEMICAELEFDVTFKDEYGSHLLETPEEEIKEEDLQIRPPVVTVMGHVDHGKTSILDYIRSTNVIAGESGGITQHIGAYQVTHNEKKITFLDTPGHEAFTAMRARGANVTDIAIIVVAANDGVMPQTVEAIDHAKAAGVTMIIAINKVDLPEANTERTIANLAEKNVFLQDRGGDVEWVECSAKTGEGIDKLLELIELSAEISELKANPVIAGKGTVIEARKDAKMGTVVTILLQEGNLKKGDNVVCGATYGRVRKLTNERNKEITEIGPSDVAVIYGLNDVPKAGDVINKVENEKIARNISAERLHIRQEREKFQETVSFNNLFRKIKEEQMSELKLIVKADTDGSVEALCDSLGKLSNDEIMVNIIHKSVGGIIEADVNLAAASKAIIVGFHIRANNQAKKLAEEQKIEIKLYNIIYDCIDEIKYAIEGMLSPDYEDEFQGSARVKQIFKIKKVGQIAGCAVERGTLFKDSKVRIYRNDIVIFEGEFASLKHYSQDVNEAKSGTECGLSIENFNDIKEGDVIEAYRIKEIKKKL